jgi:hypothetical protein
MTAALAACSSDPGTGEGNVQVQVGTYFFFQEWTEGVPRATLTGPQDSATFDFTNTPSSLSGSKDDWHKYKFDLQPDDMVTLTVVSGTETVFEQSCTVHPRALELTYAEFLAYGPSNAFDEDGNPLPGPYGAQCGCGFREYGDDRNANSCFR